MNPIEKARNAVAVSRRGDAEVSQQLFPKKSHIGIWFSANWYEKPRICITDKLENSKTLR